MRIISRREWGFTGWASNPPRIRNWRAFMVHYEGGTPCGNETGPGVPRAIHAFHRNGRGWAGIGYNFVIDQAGAVFEGRGYGLQGAHCPSWNNRAIGVQIHIGGKENPSRAALTALSALYRDACRRYGPLRVMGHRDGYATECPGAPLTAIVRDGLNCSPAPAPPGGLREDGRYGPGTARAFARALQISAWRSSADYWRKVGYALKVPTSQLTGAVNPTMAAAIRTWAGAAPGHTLHVDGTPDPAITQLQHRINWVLRQRNTS